MIHIHEMRHIIANLPLLEGALGGLIGGFLTVAAQCFVETGVTFHGWKQKMLYVFASIVVGMLLNYQHSLGLVYTTLISGSWPLVVCMSRSAVKTGIETFFKNLKKRRSS